MIHNFTYIQQNLMSWSMEGYANILGVFMWPFIFSVIVGYIYVKQESLVAAAVAILIIFAAFGDVLMGVDIFSMIMHIAVSLIFTGLVLLWISRRR